MSPFFSWQQAILKSSLEPTTRLVCLTIGCHMALDGSGCFPSYALIAEECGLGRSTVIAHVQKAVEAGYLSLANRTRDNGSSSSNLYHPVMPQVVQQRDGGSPATGPGVVQELDPHNTPSLTPQITTPPTPKGEPDGFEELWKVKWSRGAQHHAKQAAHKAYKVALKRGHKHEELLNLAKRGVGAGKVGTEYAPLLSTWLNEERWKDVSGGSVVTAQDVDAARQRTDAAAREHKERMDRLARERSDKLLGRSA